ncbi:MAG: hypothetical protein FWC59_03095, partial [Actinomycetia bacterium]|nr:hypothetical protein [Actinomycetes bacterium]
MTVELALLTPVVLVLVYITVNLLLYLAACARFDPLAAEAVRTQAASPASGCYALSSRAAATAYWLQQNFNDQNNVQIAVSAERVAYGGNLPEQLPGGENLGVVFALLPQQERFSCVLYFQPLGWPGSLFGLELP